MALRFYYSPSHDRRRCLGQPLAAKAAAAAAAAASLVIAIHWRPRAISGDASRSRSSPEHGRRISQGGSSFLLLMPWIANSVSFVTEIVLGILVEVDAACRMLRCQTICIWSFVRLL